ncbi:hypothetical protein FOC1_g10000685 [Fusarium oxysporum f. sp. cubense race 1]|uniref:Uncharacterized protein n=1 Tax=Fusarium oxysporum f. sp. cubense (strain race 1) TaxID=1229664 RepID=N4UFU6_FUSC1|nr:hypothetical protein FOC1_g10000685 [Fusarium oxysporum f. sp. cubense race 1]
MHLLRWEFMDEDDTFKIHLEQHTTVTDYAILSHRWGKPKDEVSFDDMIAGTHESKKGHEKLIGCCRQARSLQEVITRTSNDHTIFTWTSPPPKVLSHSLESVSTMLALSPRQFRDSASFEPIPRNNNDGTSLSEYQLNQLWLVEPLTFIND